MHLTELFVPSADLPCLAVKVDLDHVFSVLTAIEWVRVDSCLLDCQLKRDTEELLSRDFDFVVAVLGVIKEGLRFEEELTVRTLEALCLIEGLLKRLH